MASPGSARRIAAFAWWVVAVTAAPAWAQWTRVTGIPAQEVYALHVERDTVLAGMDSVVWISTDAGTTWRKSALVGSPPLVTDAVWLRSGRVWAGTTGGGVFTSDDLGDTWTVRNDGLTGGLFDSHLFILDFETRDDSLYAATGGAGVYVRPLRTEGPWQATGSQLTEHQAGGVEQLASDGRRLLAAAGANGEAFRNDGGLPWTAMFLDNGGLAPGLQPSSAGWSGNAFFVGTVHGVFMSPNGDAPWTLTLPDLGRTINTRVAGDGGRMFVCVNRTNGANLFWTPDDGGAWNSLGIEPTFVDEMELAGPVLWAARSDGLWRLTVPILDVPAPAPTPLAFSLRGAHPLAGPRARFALRLEQPGEAHLEVFDAGGRRVRAIHHDLPAGDHELSLDVGGLESGVYHARVRTAAGARSLRFVRLRT